MKALLVAAIFRCDLTNDVASTDQFTEIWGGVTGMQNIKSLRTGRNDPVFI